MFRPTHSVLLHTQFSPPQLSSILQAIIHLPYEVSTMSMFEQVCTHSRQQFHANLHVMFKIAKYVISCRSIIMSSQS